LILNGLLLARELQSSGEQRILREDSSSNGNDERKGAFIWTYWGRSTFLTSQQEEKMRITI